MGSSRAFRCVLLAAVSLLALPSLSLGADVLMSEGSKVGWIEPTNLNKPVSSQVRIIRAGAEVAYSDADGLLACDQVKLVDKEATLRVTLSNAQRLSLSASRPEVVIPCNTPGFAERFGSLLQAITGQAEKRRTMAATRGAIAATRSRASLSVPALVAETAEIAEGKRAIFVSWRGGEAPFRVEILRKTEDGKVTTVVAQNNVRERSVTLPQARLPVGRYSLMITGADKQWIREDMLDVVPALSVPEIPVELKQAKLDESVRMLYYADFLVGFEDGRFTLEALQKAASIFPATAASREWLSTWGTDN